MTNCVISLDKHLPITIAVLLFLQVYDLDQSKYLSKGLDFRYTDNLNFFVNCLPRLGLSKVQLNCYNYKYTLLIKDTVYLTLQLTKVVVPKCPLGGYTIFR